MSSSTLSQKDRRITKNGKSKPPPPPPPPARWTAGLFDCFSNCGTCCLVLFCFNTIPAQLYTRFIQKGCCLFFVVSLWGLYLFYTSYSSYTPTTWTLTYDAKTDTYTLLNNQMALLGVISAAGLVYSILITYLICAVRKKVRTRDAIPGNDCDDCCTSYLCNCCAQIQLLKQDNIDTSNYILTSPTGTNIV